MTLFFYELVYRGIPCNSEEWVYGSYIEHRAGNNSDDIEGRKYFIAPNAPYMLMQTGEDLWMHKIIEIRRNTLGMSSGCEDIDGTVIFSGDILERVPAGTNINGEPERFVVLYLDGVFVAEGASVLSEMSFDQCRIIGNTFKNPEMFHDISLLLKASGRSVFDIETDDYGGVSEK